MSIYGLSNEAMRVRRRPVEEPANPLAVLIIGTLGSPTDYAGRLRSVVASALDIAQSVDFEKDEDIPIDSLPQWFQLLSNEESSGAATGAVGSEGRLRYLAERDGRPWSCEDWIYCFDPGLRAWSWWDLTARADGRLSLWVDTKGEAHIPCEELWWAAYVAGASSVDSMVLDSAAVWSSQASLGSL